jgi:hypothetical protein
LRSNAVKRSDLATPATPSTDRFFYVLAHLVSQALMVQCARASSLPTGKKEFAMRNYVCCAIASLSIVNASFARAQAAIERRCLARESARRRALEYNVVVERPIGRCSVPARQKFNVSLLDISSY